MNRKCCVKCGSTKIERSSFEDKSCWKEFVLFGLCQKCQNNEDQAYDTFGVPDGPYASAVDWDDQRLILFHN